MKKHRLWNAVSHGSTVMSIVFIVLFIIDRVNPSMDFLGSEQSDWLLLLFCLFSLANGVLSAISLFKRDKAQYIREEHQREQGE